MFLSFFPRPRLFFLSAIVWVALLTLLWGFGAKNWGGVIGLPQLAPNQQAVIGVSLFWSKPFLWFYLYYWTATSLFTLFWRLYDPHPWAMWSVSGSALIVFMTYLQVQVDVTINAWYGPFYDLIQSALSHTAHVTLAQFYGQLVTFANVALVAVTASVLTGFFVNHYVFRWRAAMNSYYVANWPKDRKSVV